MPQNTMGGASLKQKTNSEQRLLEGAKPVKCSKLQDMRDASLPLATEKEQIERRLLDAFAKYRTCESNVSWKEYADENLTLNETEKIEDIASLASGKILTERSVQKTAEYYENRLPNILANFAFDYQNEIAHTGNSLDMITYAKEFIAKYLAKEKEAVKDAPEKL